MDKLIYLASPYSSAWPEVIPHRVKQTQDATARLIEQGHLVFSPIVHSHPIHDLVTFSPVNTQDSMTGWMRYDRAMIDKADEVWVLTLPGWQDSKGISEEIAHTFDQGKTVRYISYPELRQVGHIEPKFFAAENDTVYAAPIAQADGDQGSEAPARYKESDLVKVVANTYNAGFDIGQIVTFKQYRTDDNIDCEGDFNDGNRTRIIPQALALSDIRPTPKKQTVIGLNGVARSGKDTIGKYLVENHGFIRVGLADAVRDALYALNPSLFDPVRHTLQFAVDRYGWDKVKTKSKEVRQLLQRLGTEVGRNFFGENCWIDIARKKIGAAYPNPVVITDIRFDNEAEFVRKLGGKVWSIARPGVEAVNDHASEQGVSLNLIDSVIPNVGTIDYLHACIENILQGVFDA